MRAMCLRRSVRLLEPNDKRGNRFLANRLMSEKWAGTSKSAGSIAAVEKCVTSSSSTDPPWVLRLRMA